MSRTFRTKSSGYKATLNGNPFPWPRSDFAWLGTITLNDGTVIGWAWHLDGRSIDRDDDGFDLLAFPQGAAYDETVMADG